VKNVKSLPFDVELTNMPENLAALLNVVSRAPMVFYFPTNLRKKPPEGG